MFKTILQLIDPSPIDEFGNIVIPDTLVHPQFRISDSPFTIVVREILEQEHIAYPYTPHHIEQALRESRRPFCFPLYTSSEFYQSFNK